jgi:hypothetical protein
MYRVVLGWLHEEAVGVLSNFYQAGLLYVLWVTYETA